MDRVAVSIREKCRRSAVARAKTLPTDPGHRGPLLGRGPPHRILRRQNWPPRAHRTARLIIVPRLVVRNLPLRLEPLAGFLGFVLTEVRLIERSLRSGRSRPVRDDGHRRGRHTLFIIGGRRWDLRIRERKNHASLIKDDVARNRD